MTYGTVRVSITSQCGTSNYSGITVYPGNCHSIAIAPNPASDNTTVTINYTQASPLDTLDNSNSVQLASAAIPSSFNVTVTSNTGLVVFKTIEYSPLLTISVQNFKAGIYVITVNDGTHTFSSQLIVNH